MTNQFQNTGTEDVAGVLNYVDYKQRFPIIRKLYDAIDEYDNADNLYVPTNQSTISLDIRYKQDDVFTDWNGSWHHIRDLYRSDGLRQTIIELVNFYGAGIEDKSIDQSDDFLIPAQGYFSNHQYAYGEYVAYTLPWRSSFDPISKDIRQGLLNIRSWLYKAMDRYETLNEEQIKAIDEAQSVAQLLARPLSSLTGYEFLQILKISKEQ